MVLGWYRNSGGGGGSGGKVCKQKVPSTSQTESVVVGDRSSFRHKERETQAMKVGEGARSFDRNNRGEDVCCRREDDSEGRGRMVVHRLDLVVIPRSARQRHPHPFA